MDYYMMLCDDKIQNPLKLSTFWNFNKKDDLVLIEEFKKNMALVDYMIMRKFFENRFLFSDKVKEAIFNYSDDYDTRVIFVTDRKNIYQYTYWEIDVREVSCAVTGKYLDKDMIQIDKTKINKNLSLFKIVIEKKSYIIVRFDLAESILRRIPIGIKFCKLK